ncbi:MAG: hypothetical protein GY898_01720 [Proteobacteria bacterium]|nr:hypothetical protein [Pseudomonadota bacterium]
MVLETDYGGRWQGLAMFLLLVLPAVLAGGAAVTLGLTEEQAARVFVAAILGGLFLLPVVGWKLGLFPEPAGPLDEAASAVQQALMWARNDRKLMRDVRRLDDGGLAIRIGRPELPEALSARSGSAPEASRTGDAEFDRAIAPGADSVGPLLAALDAAGRARLRVLADGAADFALADGVLEARYDGDLGTDKLTERGKELIEISDLLAAGFGDVPGGLTARFLSDPSPAVRKTALDRLLRGFPDLPGAVDVGTEVLAGSDPRLGLVAARALGRTADVARFEAMLEGQRGRLAVSAAEGDEGGLALTSEAGAGALSKEPS